MIHILDLEFMGHEQTIAAFLVETTEGPVLIETGPHSTFPKLSREINALGFQVKDIQHVFLSHIHLDHAGTAWAFAEHGASIYLHPFGAKHMNDPSKLMESARRIYLDQMDSLWGQMKAIPEGQLKEVKDQEVIQVGNLKFEALHTPGHAVHHIAWKMGDQLFAGDVAGVKIGESGMVVPPCPPPDINIETWVSSINRLRKENLSAIYLTHFGRIENIGDHFNELEAILWDWADWMKPYFEAEKPVKEVIPEFEQYVKNQLVQHGLDMEGLEKYESANPSWMSVAGLMRYWKKKQV